MIKTIELTKDRIARLSNKEPFLLPDVLEFQFESIGYDLTNTFIILKNGKVEEKCLISNPFKVPEKFLFAGNLCMAIDCYINGRLAKHWDFIPLSIKETEDTLRCFDFLFELEKKIDEIGNKSVTKKELEIVVEKLNETIEKQNKLAETVSEIKENNL